MRPRNLGKTDDSPSSKPMTAGGPLGSVPKEGVQRPPLDLALLTPAERRVFDLAVRGLPVKEIAAELVLSDATVATHLSRIYAKFGVRGRAELLARLAGSGSAGRPPGGDVVAAPGGASPWPGIVVGLVGLGLGLILPLSSLVLGPGLILVALRSGTTLFGRARPLVLLVGTALIAEAALILVLYSV